MNDIKGYRWKKDDRETGLRAGAVGAGPRGSKLQNGSGYIASVQARGGGGWHGPVRGWYYVVCGDSLEHVNTCNDQLYATDKDAKIAAVECIKAQIKARKSSQVVA